MSTQDVTHPITHILIGTDGSEVSERVLQWTKDVAKIREASVTVVCAFDSPRSFRKRGSLYLEEARDSLEAEAKEIVAETVAKLEKAGVEATGVAFEGEADDGILGQADQTEADIIIIGRGGRDGVKDYLMGSTAERVIRHAGIPVFIVK
jgi:nucleotide-binding universal stress UspA family protein